VLKFNKLKEFYEMGEILFTNFCQKCGVFHKIENNIMRFKFAITIFYKMPYISNILVEFLIRFLYHGSTYIRPSAEISTHCPICVCEFCTVPYKYAKFFKWYFFS
jgi:hypothetical protein